MSRSLRIGTVAPNRLARPILSVPLPLLQNTDCQRTVSFSCDHLIICARTYFVNANSTIRTSNTKTSGMTFVAPQSCSSCLVAHPLPRGPSVRRSSSGGYSAQPSGRPRSRRGWRCHRPPLLLTRASSSEGSCSHRKQPADRLHGVWSFGALGDCAKVHNTMYDFKPLSLRCSMLFRICRSRSTSVYSIKEEKWEETTLLA